LPAFCRRAAAAPPDAAVRLRLRRHAPRAYFSFTAMPHRSATAQQSILHYHRLSPSSTVVEFPPPLITVTPA